jgi:hypothetical protein
VAQPFDAEERTVGTEEASEEATTPFGAHRSLVRLIIRRVVGTSVDEPADVPGVSRAMGRP